MEESYPNRRKHCGKRRNCSLRAISPFPTVFSKGLFPRASKGVIVCEWVNADCKEVQCVSGDSVIQWCELTDRCIEYADLFMQLINIVNTCVRK